MAPSRDAQIGLRGHRVQNIQRAESRRREILLTATRHTYGFARDATDGSPVLALFSTAAEPASIPVFETAAPAGIYIDVLTGAEVPVGVGGSPAAVDVAPGAFRVLVPASSPCR